MSEFLEPRVINGITYYPEVGVIDAVLNGLESHGIPAWNIFFKFGNAGQGTGNRRSDTPSGQQDIRAVLYALKASSLEELEGKYAVALHSGCTTGQIVGIANLNYPESYALFSN